MYLPDCSLLRAAQAHGTQPSARTAYLARKAQLLILDETKAFMQRVARDLRSGMLNEAIHSAMRSGMMVKLIFCPRAVEKWHDAAPSSLRNGKTTQNYFFERFKNEATARDLVEYYDKWHPQKKD